MVLTALSLGREYGFGVQLGWRTLEVLVKAGWKVPLAYPNAAVNGRGRSRAQGRVGMSQIHCHFCGGIIQDVAAIEYRPPRFSAQFAMPHTAPCTCSPPVVYEHPPVLGGPEEDQTPDGEAA